MTSAEEAALDFLKSRGGSCLVTEIPDKTEKGILGETIAGMAIYRKLQRQGYVNITEEEPMEDGFLFTDMIELIRDPR